MNETAPQVQVFQEGMSQRHTARCECGWQESVGSLRAARDLANQHRRDGCATEDKPRSVQLVPADPTPAPPATVGQWSGEQLELLRQQICPGASDDELAFFAQVANHKQLDPFLGEIVGIMRWDSRARREVMKIQETVEGLRTIAERSGRYGGYRGPQFTADGFNWSDVWLDTKQPPAAARYWVIRKDWTEPAVGVARWASNVQLTKDGKVQPGPWRDRPDEMLAKCAEVRALKRAFSKEFARAGIEIRELSDAQVVSMEARAAGLDDDARHTLAEQVSEGRTRSTRELTDDETLEFRVEVAQTEPVDAVQRTIARAAGNLEQRMERLDPRQLAHMKEYRRAKGYTRPLITLPLEHRLDIAGELDRCEREGWPNHTVEEPAADEDDAVVPGDVAEPDLFDEYSDEPF